jgi:hypothetical protein
LDDVETVEVDVANVEIAVIEVIVAAEAEEEENLERPKKETKNGTP